MKLNHKNITIRNAESRDAGQLAAWWNDGAVMAHAGFPRGLGVTAKEIADSLRTDGDSHRRLILEADGKPIGEMNYRVLEDGAAEIGIKICEETYQGKGIGRTALSMLIRALFERGCSRIVLDTNLKNRRAQHVYETLGFAKTGVRYDSWQDQLGNWQSAVDYELTEDRFVMYQ